MAQPLKKMFSGRLIMAGINGIDPDRETAMLVRDYGVCNFIIFRRNVLQGPERLQNLVSSVRRMCREEGLPEPVFAVDQEGGTVQRLAAPFWCDIQSNRSAAASLDAASAIKQQALSAASVLSSVGIDLNLAPVLDLSGRADNGVLRERTYSHDPDVTARLGNIYIETLQSEGVGATAKHFPGIGRVEQDPHERRPVVDAGKGCIIKDAGPFRAAVHSGVKAMMTSHVIYKGLDPDNPATFSQGIATRLLRDEFCFEGMLVTDDLEMGGVTGYGSIGHAAVKAVEAGHDLILVCHEARRVVEAVTALERELLKDGGFMRRVEEAAERIDAFRKWRHGRDCHGHTVSGNLLAGLIS